MRNIALLVRSPLFRLWIVILGVTASLLAGLGWSTTYLEGLKPPGCNDSRTLALVGWQLARLLGPVAAPTMVRIRTVTGGALAIRFLCTADFANPDRIRLPNGTVVHTIRFSSALGLQHVQQVTVRLEPVLQWEQVE